MRGFVGRHLAGLVLIAALALHAFFLKAQDTDFAIFERAAARFVAGEPLYRTEDTVADGSSWTDRSFKYAPAAAAFFVPFNRLLWLLASGVALALAAHWATQASGAQRLQWLPLVMVAGFTHAVFSLGQSDAVVLGLFAGSELLRGKNRWLAATCAAAAVLLKVTFLFPVLLLAVLRREWRGAVMVLVLGFGIPLLRYGPAGALEQHRAWLALLSTTTPELLCRASNQGVWAMACSGPALVIAALSASALIVGLRALVWKPPSEFQLAATAVFMAALWSPLCWRSTLVCLLPAYYLVVTGRRPYCIAAGVLAFAAAFPVYDVLGPSAFSWALGVRLYGVLALGAFVLAALGTRSQLASKQ